MEVGPNKVLTVEDFLSDSECDELTAWTTEHYTKPYFVPICGRTSTRMSSIKVPFPEKAYEIQKKITNLLGLHNVSVAPFSSGFYSGFSRNKKEVTYEPHRDPIYMPETYTLHCNVVTTDSSGGEVKIEGHGVYEMNKGRLVVYPVSELTHQVLPARSEGIRNLWVFGFCVPWGLNEQQKKVW